MRIGFSPRRQALTIYLMTGVRQVEAYLPKLGKAKSSKACLYIKKLEDVDTDVLTEMLKESLQLVEQKWG